MGLDYRRALLTERRYERTQRPDTYKAKIQGHLVSRYIQHVESGNKRPVLWNDNAEAESAAVKGGGHLE
jgi:hypothetical protein